MAKGYYYFVSSLPPLQFQSIPDVKLEEILAECQHHLADSDYKTLEKTIHFENLIYSNHRNPTAYHWQQFVISLTNAIGKLRAHRKNWDIHGQKIYGGLPEEIIERVCAELTKIENPQSAEELIDEAKWNKLEELSTGHYFDLDIIIIYVLKLQILERLGKIRSADAQESLQNILVTEEKS